MATNIDIDSLPTLREVVKGYTLEDWFGRRGGSEPNRRAFELPCHPEGCIVVELDPLKGISSIDFQVGYGPYGYTIRMDLVKFRMIMTESGYNRDGEKREFGISHDKWKPHYGEDFSIIEEINKKLISLLEKEGLADDPVSYHSYLDEYWDKIGYKPKSSGSDNNRVFIDPDDFIPRLI